MTRTEKTDCQGKMRKVIQTMEKIHRHFWCEDVIFRLQVLQTQINKRQPAPGRRDGRK